MKRSNSNSRLRNIVIQVSAAVLILCLFSCAQKVNFQTSTAVPAARGDVKVKKDDNNNYHIKIKITGLAEAKRLQPAKQVYVVWLESQEHITKNLGQINSSSTLLSKKLKASFETVSPLKPIKIFITAEDDAGTQYPGSHRILTSDDF